MNQPQKETVEALADIFIADSQRFSLEPNTLARCCFVEGYALGYETAARAALANATIPRPEGIVEAIRVLDEEADLLLVAIGHVPGINEARKRFILAQSKALRAIGK